MSDEPQLKQYTIPGREGVFNLNEEDAKALDAQPLGEEKARTPANKSRNKLMTSKRAKGEEED